MTRFKLLGDILVMAEKLAASVATAHAYFPTFSMKATGKKMKLEALVIMKISRSTDIAIDLTTTKVARVLFDTLDS